MFMILETKTKGEKMNRYKEKYILYGAELNDCTSKEEVRKHNAAMKKLSALYYEVSLTEDKSFLLELLKYPNDRIRTLVAAHCLGMNIYMAEAQKALKEIMHNKRNPVIAFNARSTLKVWKKQGSLTF